MEIQKAYQLFQNKQRLTYIVIVCLIGMIVVNVFTDYLFSAFQNSGFYISESLLFSSYWVLFIPFMLLLFFNRTIGSLKIVLKFLLAIGLILLHLIFYPALVWILSEVFYEHTFSFWPTFNYGISAYLIKTIIIYGFSLPAFMILNRKYKSSQVATKIQKETDEQIFINSIMISDNGNKKLLLYVNEILYFSANPPYVNIYHPLKKYIHSETLKSLEIQLNEKQFVRIHKSHIVNVSKILSIQSRKNGDYDVTLTDGSILRLSRNYVKNFKLKFSPLQLTSK